MVAAPAAPRATIRSWSAVSPFGYGRDTFVDGLRTARDTAVAPDPLHWDVPDTRAHLVPDFDARTVLGKKGTRSMDRATALAVTAVRQLIDSDAGAEQPDADETALVLGTTGGSSHSIATFARDGLTAAKPYLVDPARFPNAVMNCAAGTTAIWHALRGPNTTIAAGRVSGLHALSYSLRLLGVSRAAAVLCGAVEEYSPTRSWIEGADPDDGTVLGEGCAMLSIHPASADGDGAAGLADVLTVDFGVFDDDPATVLAACLRRAVTRAGVSAADIWALSPGAPGGDLAGAEDRALAAVFGDATAVRVPALFGDTGAAAVPFQIVTALALAQDRPEASGRVAVVTALDVDGQAGCALLRLR
ncbi:beta-ketoacyl synthase N-terminal-like domain-containing protein [Micromonospora sp. WMMD1120]|uniref:beta-ketoacyl synthase N-terminal-like domain-containing protein n=1 Tax=Micromonospora sp. WMMD1120 TaxID=3016106 RepID=UPI002415CB4F|nr:beta-ketoacyl synthase N-terminal-like domain-containing protein [Micromonospora sp. WMMD1120]MDG4810814.1 beta-ketoacyl synthase N-terminal-like domain-containing protein [Micromonospora sp. WMMD1120]